VAPQTLVLKKPSLNRQIANKPDRQIANVCLPIFVFCHRYELIMSASRSLLRNVVFPTISVCEILSAV